ncbi:MAG: MFS transporter [Actinomycetota bacterium]|nr:MFS transporter [Actinomycetota bacterium]
MAYRIIAFHTLASFGWGLVFPFTAIYLASKPGIGPGSAALYYAGAGSANLLVAIVLAAARKRPPDNALAALGTLLSVIGYLTLSVAGNNPTVVTAALCNGLGQGCLMAAIIPIVNSLIPPERRREVFARRYQCLNVALALGAVIAGGGASLAGRRMLPLLFVGQAVAYLPLVGLLVRRALRDFHATRTSRSRPRHESEQPPPATPIRALIGMTAAAALFQLGAYMFGYSQFEATAPLVADRLLSTGLFVVSLMLAINVAVIVLVQGSITKWLSRWDEAKGLRSAMYFWIVGYAIAAVTSVAPRPFQLAGLLSFAILFGVGECAYSCSFHPWLIQLTPSGELTRASALVNSMMGIGMFIGPAFGVALVGLGHAPLVWATLVACCSAMVALTGRRSGSTGRLRNRHGLAAAATPQRVP